jgi:putative ABC transport system ATP-binding protein
MLIELRKVEKIYSSGTATTKALNSIDLSIDEGEFVALMGASGSGKSTTMNIIGFMDKVTHGDYLFKGKSVTKYSSDELADMRNREIGFVFQSFNLLPRTSVLENVMLPLHYRRMKSEQKTKLALEALQKVGLESRANSKSNQLSGGQIQRVAIARAIVSNPSILIADEPTGNLDSKTSAEIMEIFKSLNKQGKTIILVTHEEDIAAYARRTVTLKDGQIISNKPNRK